jgi:hypothetical protein
MRGMDSNLIKGNRQDLQDFFVPHFPEENEENPSDFVGKRYYSGLVISSTNYGNLDTQL